ncbi:MULTISPECIES: prolyl oligopeptidase family serine peptidase [Caulobacter]|jgi:dipeptidyl aminopeptidase/acylaminoacyl peptidase|uniref:Dipeptidyl aminopeptidase/acylaminoacyl peptidase n=1 Tax=Caulobacter vibrioides OR37 TaxID=1292034 RepID=R0EIH0_CAUVI|nr:MULTISPECIES: prolyl oligopeptidase family serine peptidase [Caulobacter]ENZ80982.1 dipeptidyl aminopeptidase/acylaminoacyl peptidase [Caulobacter vibrioides OR37]MBQ1559365.1 S9 family peptidase [Caulobacter sp.]
MIYRHALALALLAGAVATPLAAQTVAPPVAIVVDGAPAIPRDLVEATAPYLQARHADFLGWNAADHSMLIKTRFGGSNQVHVVAKPDGDRRQISFESEPILTAALSPKGDTLVIQKDKGGDEFYQLYVLEAGRPRLITDGKSRNWFGAWSRDGKLVGYASSRRNGADMDLYVVDPKDPKTDRLVAQVTGGGWNIVDFSADGAKALVLNRMSVNEAMVYELDLASGKMKALTNPKAKASYVDPKYAQDGSVWLTSDKGSDFQRLGKLDGKGGFVPVSKEPRWDVSDFAVSPDGTFAVYAINEAGVSRVRILDLASGAVRPVDGLPAGVIPYAIGPAISIAPWGEIGLSMASAKVPGDAFSIDPKTLAVTQWTRSETGGLDPSRNVEPKLVEVASFDGEKISGFLYQPDPAKFPGKRPLIVDIHGGPEGQTRPDFLGGNNYLLNELGVALFFPNVRGSTGYGTRFVNLDNGPFKREDSVKDIGVFLDTLEKNPALDASRFAVNGVSYGGYMCYASATHYSPRLKGANCYVAISNFVTFLENTQAYRRDLRRVEYGDERDPKQREQLMKISPLTSVDKITTPLLVATGGTDPRVPPSEAEQMIKAVRARGGSVWHVLAKNEGHVFRKKENEDYYFWTSIMFWRKTLLGQ